MNGPGARKWNDFIPHFGVRVICQFDCSTEIQQTKSVTPNPTIQTSTLVKSSTGNFGDFGKVSKCTLSGLTKTFTVNGRTYCVVKKGKMIRADADQSCKNENARLPLPKNDDEVKAFHQFSKASTWIDLSVPGRVQNYCTFN